MKVRAKLCGLTTQDDIDAAATAGAAYIGLVFFEKSPRNVTIETAAAWRCMRLWASQKLLWW